MTVNYLDVGLNKKAPDFSEAFSRTRFAAVETGFEPATPCVTGTYSNQLNYPTDSHRYRVLFDPKIKVIVASFEEFAVLFSKVPLNFRR